MGRPHTAALHANYIYLLVCTAANKFTDANCLHCCVIDNGLAGPDIFMLSWPQPNEASFFFRYHKYDSVNPLFPQSKSHIVVGKINHSATSSKKTRKASEGLQCFFHFSLSMFLVADLH